MNNSDDGYEVWVDSDYTRGPRNYEKCKDCGEDLALTHSCRELAALRKIRELHRPCPNSVSAMYPKPLCSCDAADYPDCPTAAVLDAAGIT